MGKYDKLTQQNTEQRNIEKSKFELARKGMQELSDDTNRTADVYKNANVVLDDIDKRFEEATSLEKDDIAFLFFAIALQCFRQYVLTNFKERLSDKEAAKKTKGHKEEHSARGEVEWYLRC